MRSPLLRFALLFAAALPPCACAARQPAPSPQQLFAELRLGMTRAEVEARLGAPIMKYPARVPVTRYGTRMSPMDNQTEAWYLPPPPLRGAESPYAPGCIGVTYDSGGRLVEKRLNPQACDRPAGTH